LCRPLGEKVDAPLVERTEEPVERLPCFGCVERVAVGGGSEGKAIRHQDTFLGQYRVHLPQRGVLAADQPDVGKTSGYSCLSALALLVAREYQMQAAVAIIDLDQGRAVAVSNMRLDASRVIVLRFFQRAQSSGFEYARGRRRVGFDRRDAN
jgi:hypothetical protein